MKDGTAETKQYSYSDKYGVQRSGNYTWTPQTWWLDNESAGTTGTLDGGIDIPLNNLWPLDTAYLWNDTVSAWVKEQAYVMSSSQSAPPDFTFGASDLVTTVKSQLQTLYSDSASSLKTIPSIALPALTEFPSL